MQDKLKEIKKYYKGRYDTKLEDAVNDIQKYVDALELNELLPDFVKTKENYLMSYRISDLPSYSDLAPYLDGDFSEIGGAMSVLFPFLRLDDEGDSNKRLNYGLELRYYDRNLYVFGLEIERQSLKEDDGKRYWGETDRTTLSDLSNFKKPEFGWIMDRLEGLVTQPSKELWNEWHPKKK